MQSLKYCLGNEGNLAACGHTEIARLMHIFGVSYSTTQIPTVTFSIWHNPSSNFKSVLLKVENASRESRQKSHQLHNQE